MKKLWDSSEIQEATMLFNDLIKDFSIPGSAIHTSRFPGRGGRPSHTYRGDLLENALISMCRRGDFKGAVLVDNNGLPLATYNSPLEMDMLAAFTSILGRSLEETVRLFEQPDANNISIDINDMEKVVLRKFLANNKSYFVMIICPKETEERTQLEVSINHIITILTEK
jgi:predicted regulator of Ras-like GTPase activity (Roadblock/LC7/MglB family)